MAKTLKELKNELNAAVSDRDRITSRASSIPARREAAAEELHTVKKAHARGDGGEVRIKEARAALHALRDQEELVPYEADAARERVLEAEIALTDAEYREAMEEASAEFQKVVKAREQKEHFAGIEAHHTGRSSAAEGQANRAKRRGKDATIALQRLKNGRQVRREQTLADAGVAPHTRQRRRGEVQIG